MPRGGLSDPRTAPACCLLPGACWPHRLHHHRHRHHHLPLPLQEPALNPALEEQAIGRAWRMGQRRNVVVKKFYVEGSVEERIMEVCGCGAAAAMWCCGVVQGV